MSFASTSSISASSKAFYLSLLDCQYVFKLRANCEEKIIVGLDFLVTVKPDLIEQGLLCLDRVLHH